MTTLPVKTSRRKCKDHEREWHGFCVDRNLEDDWLEGLNNLEIFNLISICEGHYDRQAEPSRRTSPHIRLRLKEDFLVGVTSRWDEHKMMVVSEVNRLFQTADTYVGLELKFKLRSTTSRLIYEESLTMRIHSRQPRTLQEMDDGIRDWFRRSVRRIEELDSFVARLWHMDKSDPATGSSLRPK
jgi:hypothetical protein